ncbi:hypothetical protein OsJ_25230 [Oryza sativa Japonica Group]|uniref:malate dehydrogenase n=1 Tax=Oryza sativa subsp. japonica TaxID=39947 RepID=B9FUD5_ORYSJ|nr:hypothetical protein OsJ_25230 [Oryza sativa Japonica Group]
MSTLNLSSSPLTKQQLRFGASTLSAEHVSGFSSARPAPSLCCSSSHWRAVKLRPRRRPWRRAGNRVVAQAGGYKVAILGAAGGIGQPLSLLVKMSPLVSALHLYDIANVDGVTADLGHCNTPAKVAGFTGKEELAGCLAGVDVVVIPAGVPRKPGMTRDDLFGINAGIVRELVEAVADHAPAGAGARHLQPGELHRADRRRGAEAEGRVRPAEAVRRHDAGRRARQHVRRGDEGPPARRRRRPGGSAATRRPPSSRCCPRRGPKTAFTDEEVEALTRRIQNAGTEVVEAKAKAGGGSATLSMAYAAARFLEASLRGLDGDADVYECSYVQCQAVPELPFFACRVKLGRDGVEEVAAAGAELRGLTEFEARALEALKPQLKKSIDKGVAYAQQQPATVAMG